MEANWPTRASLMLRPLYPKGIWARDYQLSSSYLCICQCITTEEQENVSYEGGGKFLCHARIAGNTNCELRLGKSVAQNKIKAAFKRLSIRGMQQRVVSSLSFHILYILTV